MRLTSLTPAVVLLAACATTQAPLRVAAEPSPARAPHQVKEYSIDEFLRTVNHSGSSFSPDGTKILVSNDSTGIFNAYAIPVAGGEPVALTASTDDAVRVLSYFPNDERFLYFSDRGGNELAHIYVRAVDGTVKDLTPGDKLRAQFVGWANDYRSFFVSTNERDPKFFDLYEYQTDTYARTMLFQNDVGMSVRAISPDRRFLALSKLKTTNDNDVHLLDRQTKELKHLTPHQGVAFYSPEEFTLDGKGLLMSSNEGREFAQLVRYDLASGKTEALFAPEWDVMYAAYSRGNNYLVVGVNADAKTELRVFEAATMKPVTLPTVEGDIMGVSFSNDDAQVAVYVSNSSSPNDLFVAQVSGGEPKRLTRSLSPAIDPRDLVEGQVVRFPSYDGLKIPGILYKPHQASPGNKVPALVMVHGGPGGQARIGYKAQVQYYVNHGYAVFDINNRGSSGYGKTFFGADDQKHGEADLGDVVESKKMLIDTGWVDPHQIGILGGSYGGYMVLAALAFQPDEFAVGVNIFGVANWLRTLNSIPVWWTVQREALFAEMGDPAKDEERLRRISPLFHAKNIKKPLIVLQGANDPRVLKVESDEIVAAVKANGVPVEYVVFPDEGHGFVKKENTKKGWEAILHFLDTHLKGKAAPVSSAN